MNDPTLESDIFITVVRSERQIQGIRLLLHSIRSFGGVLSDSPVWLFSAGINNNPFIDLEKDGVTTFPLNLPSSVKDYWFASKVSACAQAEAIVNSSVRSLIWVSSDTMFIQPPVLFQLGDSYDAALRPVHIQNVGLQVSDRINEYWQKVYDVAGVQDVSMTVESFVDKRRLRAYFNSHAFSINPQLGLLQQWLECFQTLATDAEFQTGPCLGDSQRVFLHQTILSALMATSLDERRIFHLPPEYNYPYNLQGDIPDEKRARSLNELVSIAYEDRPLHPDWVRDIEITEPLRSWLAEHHLA